LSLLLSDVLSDAIKGAFTDNGKNQLLIKGDEGDVVEFSKLLSDGSDNDDWTQANDAVAVEGVLYNAYQHTGANAELQMQQGVHISLM
jgi:hypothetical protein